jgi:hypothetical protein
VFRWLSTSFAARRPTIGGAVRPAQVLSHVAELPDDSGIAEVAGRGLSGPTEGDGTDMAWLSCKRLV